jgi:DNA-directed RNA polymerase sigma subunit (sigma70/sigma32)
MARKDLVLVRQLAVKLKANREELRDAIVAARESGETLQNVANAAGVTRQRIAQILEEYEKS